MTIVNNIKQLIARDKYFLFVFTLVSIALLRVFQAFLGYAEMDSGLYGTGALYFDDYPSSMIYWSRFYLSLLLSTIFTDGSFLALRLMQVVSDVLLFVAIWYFLKQYISKISIVLGAFLYTFLTATQFQEYSYNNVSIFLLVIAVIALYKGLEKDNHWFIMASSLCVAISVLARFPNILAFSIILFIPFYNYTQDKPIFTKALLKSSLFFIIGGLLGVIFSFVLLLVSGHFDAVWQTIVALFSMVTTDDTAYSSGSLLHTLFIQYGVAWRVLLLFVLFMFVSTYLFSFIKNKLIRFGGLFLIFVSIAHQLFTLNLLPYLSYALAIYVFFNAIFYTPLTNTQKHLLFFALFLLVVYPMGSACPIGFAGSFSFIFVFPILIHFILNNAIEKPFFSTMSEVVRSQFKTLLLLLLFTIFGLSFFKFAAYEQDRKTHALVQRATINSPVAKGILTSHAKATEINKLLTEFGSLVKHKPCIINFHPTLLYLMEARPYGVYYPDWLDDKALIISYLNSAYEEQKCLPLLLFDKNKRTEFDQVIYDFVASHDSIVVLKETESHILYAPITNTLK